MQKLSALLLSLSLILNACGSSDVDHPALRSQPLTIIMPVAPCVRGEGFMLEAPLRAGETAQQYQTRLRTILQRYGVTDVSFYGEILPTGFYVRMTDAQAQKVAYEPEIQKIMANQLCPMNP